MSEEEKKEGKACLHCQQLPGYSQSCTDTGEVYWSLGCKCKDTPYYRSQTSAEWTWERVTSSSLPEEAKKVFEASGGAKDFST
jgi:hypothetical protein